MIFSHTWKMVLSGQKTVTRRLVKPGEYDTIQPDERWPITDWDKLTCEVPHSQMHLVTVDAVYTASGRVKWRVGQTYAVQPGRTEKGIARIRLTGIRRERLQDITEEDAWAEGCYEKITDWIEFGEVMQAEYSSVEVYADLWYSIHTAPGTTWADNPEVWVLEFELARGA